MIILEKNGITAMINELNQQLVSLSRDGVEYMHGGGKPAELQSPEDKNGWGNSEIVMFPIVGPAKDNTVTVDGLNLDMPQHGLSRHMEREIKNKTPFVAMKQDYRSGYGIAPKIPNFPVTTFPLSWQLMITYELENDGLEAHFSIENKDKKGIPYAFGWHPAFRIQPDGIARSEDGSYTMQDVKKASETGALIVKGRRTINYEDSVRRLKFFSDMGHTMLWSPADSNLMCIEPVTALPDKEFGGELKDKPGYEILPPRRTVEYFAKIQLL